MEIILIIVVVVGGVIALNIYLTAQRRKYLMEKYQDAGLVERLMRRIFWEGQTAGQLLDSLGRPVEIDRKVMKSRTREIWKYNRRTKTRFGLRITVEDGVVVGWDKKA